MTKCFSYPDEFESTRLIGERQFKKAADLFTKASEEIQGKVDYRHAFVDFSQLEVKIDGQDEGSEVVKTCPAAMGFGFAAGTTDGPGAFDFKQGDDQVKTKCSFQLAYEMFSTILTELVKLLRCDFVSGKSILEAG